LAWLDRSTAEWSVQNWHIGELLGSLGTTKREVVMNLVKKGDDQNLLKAVNVMDRFDGTDIELCMEIIKRTDNEDIWSRVSSVVYSTGVVSGEDGLARAYESKAEEL